MILKERYYSRRQRSIPLLCVLCMYHNPQLYGEKMIHSPASGGNPSIEQGEAVEEAIQVPSSVGSRSTIHNHGSDKKENLISTHPTFRLKFAFEGGESCCGYRNLRLGDLPQLSLDSLLTEVRSLMIMEAACSSSVNWTNDTTATTTTLPTTTTTATTTTTTVHPHHDHTKITLTYQDKDGDLAIIGSTLEFIYGILEFQEEGSLLIYVKLAAVPSLFASVPNNTVPTTSSPTGTTMSNSSTTTTSNSPTSYANVAHTPETAGPVVAVTVARPTRSRNDPPGAQPNSRAASPAMPAVPKRAAPWTTRPFVPAVATRHVVPIVTKTSPPVQSTAAASSTITNNNSNSSARTNTTCCPSAHPVRKAAVAASDPPPKPAAARTSVAVVAATAAHSNTTAHARTTMSSTTSQQEVVTAPALTDRTTVSSARQKAAGPGPTRAVSCCPTKAAAAQSPPTPRRAAPATNSSTKRSAVPVAPMPYPSTATLPPHTGQYCTARTTMTMMMPPTLSPPPASSYFIPPPHPPASPYAMPSPHPPPPPPQAMPLLSPMKTPVLTLTGSSSSSRTTTRTKTPTKREAASTTKTEAVKKPKTTAASTVKSEQLQEEAKTNNNNTMMSVDQDASLEGVVVPVTSSVTPLPTPKVGSTLEKICNSLMELPALNIYKPLHIQVKEAYKQHTNHQAAGKYQTTQQQEHIDTLQSEVRSHEEYTAALQQQNQLLRDVFQKILGEDNNASRMLESPRKRHQLQQALAGPTTMTTAGAAYSATAPATLIPAMATPSLGMQHMTTLPGATPGTDMAATRVAELTIPDDTTPVTGAASKTTPSSPMIPTADVLVMRATAATVASDTTTTEMTTDAAPTMGPTTTLATISHNAAAVPSVPSSPQALVQVAAMVGSMTAARQQGAKGVTIANMLRQLYKQKQLSQHVKDDKSFASGSLNLPFVDRADRNKYHCALELALYVCSEEELAKLRSNNMIDLELHTLTKKIELKAVEKIQKLLNKKRIQGKILGIGNQVLNFKRQHGAKTYNDKQLHVCIAAAITDNNNC